MGELERNIAIVGTGRLGTLLAAALDTPPPLGRGANARGARVVLLCVPDGQVAHAAAALAPGALVGHCSGSLGLAALAPHEAFSLHPLMTVPGGASADVLEGAGCAVAGATPRALAEATALAGRLGMRPSEVAEEDRAAYHAAASMASNFLVTLEAAAERVAATAGVERELLAPLVRASAENWAALGAAGALTGPIARGDSETVERHRYALTARTPELLPLYDELARATRALKDRSSAAARTTGGMRVVRSVADLRAALAPARAAGASIALVPTMGAFHAGHEALMRAARTADVVVVSLFVNPTQFNEAADLAAYPRDELRDEGIARAAGVDVLFAPSLEEVYPAGFATTASVAGITDRLEGAQRGPAHFAAVATVVVKLLGMVDPDVAYFGQKDAQQLAVVRRVAADLNLRARIEAVPTVREADGLALSSRNVRLTPADRERALSLSSALRAAEGAVAAGARDPGAIRAAAVGEMTARGIEPEYLELVDPDSFAPLDAVNGRVLVAVAARVGAVRLIDNTLIVTDQGR